ncbi:AAA family ATPase [Streptomyces sp. NPDC058247]|uniref:AAA family ATPase n=1 Tax=Streptomyces sp. NPDC058247 TaxID=3346401 RepID=UPI0036E2EE80
MDIEAAAAHLVSRYPELNNTLPERMVHAIASSDLRVEWRDIAIRWEPDFKTEQPPASAEDAEAALVLLALVRRMLDNDERRLIDIARDRKVTWPRIAEALGLGQPQGAQQRRKRLEAEDALLDPARRTSEAKGARRMVSPAVPLDVFEQTVSAWQADHPIHPLTSEQIGHARALATSKRLVETVNSAAGTGRAAMVDLLTRAVRASGGRVIGLGLGKIAAEHVFGEEGGTAYPLADWLDARRKARAERNCPAEYSLGPGDVLFMHDAHAATPQERDTLARDAASNGALVRFTGTLPTSSCDRKPQAADK